MVLALIVLATLQKFICGSHTQNLTYGEFKHAPAVDGRLAGLVAVSDPVKATSADALAALRKCGLRIARWPT